MADHPKLSTEADFLVIGAGMAGLAAAEQLSLEGRVIVLEQEDNPAYHATGRSAAIFADSYADIEIQTLSRISRPIFEAPPFAIDHPLLSPRGLLHIRLIDTPPLEADDKRAGFPKLSVSEARALAPALRPERFVEGYHEASAADIDVHGLQTALIRETRARGGQVLTRQRVSSARHIGGKWHVTAGDTVFTAPIVVNAAGAWAGEIALRFGAVDPGFHPLRRTAILVDAPTHLPPTSPPPSTWPMVIDLAESRFFKPESGKFLVSPADETPCEPHDAYAEELEIATAVHLLEEIADFNVQHVSHSWAGLRSFMPDRIPSIGFDPDVEGFFWLAGQGGSGIQTAPAQGLLTRSLVTERDHLPAGFDLDLIRRYFSPSRFQHRQPAAIRVTAQL